MPRECAPACAMWHSGMCETERVMRSEMELFAACMCPYAQQCVPLRACVLECLACACLHCLAPVEVPRIMAPPTLQTEPSWQLARAVQSVEVVVEVLVPVAAAAGTLWTTRRASIAIP